MADVTVSANVDSFMQAADYAAMRTLLNVADGSEANATGVTISANSGEALGAGDVGYLKSDGKIWQTDASAEATAGGNLVGIVTTTVAGADLATGLQISGNYTDTGLTAASAYYISETAGAKTTTAPTTDASIVRVLGYATSTTNFFISPDETWVENGPDTTESIIIAVGDETTDLTTGTAKVTFRMPYALTLTDVRASVTTAPVGSTIIVDINDGGTTIMTTNKLSIDATEKTSTTAATAPGITDTALADDAEITIDIDQIGSGTAGAGLKVTLIGTRP